jgi:transcriptional regulator with XRE-family HTH domain
MNFLSKWVKLRKKEYRRALVDSTLKVGVPFQIRAMRKKLGWSQGRLAKESGLTQGAISRAENPNYGNLTFNTVLDIAGGLDVAFIGAFVPFSRLQQWKDGLSEDIVLVATFDEEDAALREREREGTPIPSPDYILDSHLETKASTGDFKPGKSQDTLGDGDIRFGAVPQSGSGAKEGHDERTTQRVI